MKFPKHPAQKITNCRPKSQGWKKIIQKLIPSDPDVEWKDFKNDGSGVFYKPLVENSEEFSIPGFGPFPKIYAAHDEAQQDCQKLNPDAALMELQTMDELN